MNSPSVSTFGAGASMVGVATLRRSMRAGAGGGSSSCATTIALGRASAATGCRPDARAASSAGARPRSDLRRNAAGRWVWHWDPRLMNDENHSHRNDPDYLARALAPVGAHAHTHAHTRRRTRIGAQDCTTKAR